MRVYVKLADSAIHACCAVMSQFCDAQVFTPSMPRGYSLQSFRNDLKALMLKAGLEGQPVCLLLEDRQLVDAGFLECVNSLLSGGEVGLP